MTYSRALIKLSGEALMGDKPYGIDPEIVQSIAKDVSKVVENGQCQGETESLDR